MKNFFRRKAAVGAAKEFLKGYKCLTERGVGRVDGAIEKILAYEGVIKNNKKVKLARVAEMEEMVYGLMMFREGNEGGFAEFERVGTIGLLEKFIKSRGKI